MLTGDIFDLVILDFQQNAANFKKMIPLRLRINGIELLGNMEPPETFSPWQNGWVHLFATAGLYMLWLSKEVEQGTGINFDSFAGGISFITKNNIVEVTAVMDGEMAYVNYDALFLAWQEFGRKVHKAFIERHPEMKDYPWWQILYDFPGFLTILDEEPIWYRHPDPFWYEEDE